MNIVGPIIGASCCPGCREEEEGSVLITDQDGIGELAITTLVREPDDAPETSLSKIAQWSRPRSAAGPPPFCDFSGVTGQFTEEGTVLRSGTSATASRYCIAPMPVMPRTRAWICRRWRRFSARWCREMRC